MTKQIVALKAAVEGDCGLTLNTVEAAELLREMQDNDLPLIYADYQSKRTWKDECARLQHNIEAGSAEIVRLRDIVKSFMAIAVNVPIGDFGDLPLNPKIGFYGVPDPWTCFVCKGAIRVGEETITNTTAGSVKYQHVKCPSQVEPGAPRTISGQAIIEGSERADGAAKAKTAEHMKRVAGKVHVMSAFHCDFGCDVPSHKPGCPFYENRTSPHE